MRKLLAPIAISLAIQGCASKPTDPDENVAHKPEFQNVVQQFEELGIPANSTTWGELRKKSAKALNVCLDIAIEKYDDGVSTASDIARIIKPICSPYNKIFDLAWFEGKKPKINTNKSYHSIAVNSIIMYRANIKVRKEPHN